MSKISFFLLWIPFVFSQMTVALTLQGLCGKTVSTMSIADLNTLNPPPSITTDADLREWAEKKQRKLCPSSCRSDYQAYRKNMSEFRGACAGFSAGVSGSHNCSALVNSCLYCPNQKSFKGHRCAQIHNKSQCPELLGEELEQAIEKRKEHFDRMQDIEDDIQQIQEEITDKQNELADLANEFDELKGQLETDLTEQKDNLEADFEEQKVEIPRSFEERRRNIQAELDKALEVRHAFKNAITDTHSKFRQDQNRILQECRNYALERLARYREERRKAIRQGNFKKENIFQLMSPSRASFQNRDQKRYDYYYRFCMKQSSNQMKENKIARDESLKRIEQQKKEYALKIKNLIKEVAQLQTQATQSQQTLIDKYKKNLTKILTRFAKEDQKLMVTFSRNQLKINNSLNQLRRRLIQKSGKLRAEKSQFHFFKETQNYLKAQGVKQEKGDVSFHKLIQLYSTHASANEDLVNRCCPSSPSSGNQLQLDGETCGSLNRRTRDHKQHEAFWGRCKGIRLKRWQRLKSSLLKKHIPLAYLKRQKLSQKKRKG